MLTKLLSVNKNTKRKLQFCNGYIYFNQGCLWNNINTKFLKIRTPKTSLATNRTYLLTYSMVQSPSLEANWFAASQEIPRISRNPKVQYRTYKRPPPVSILDQPNLVHIPTSHLPEIHPNIIHPSTPRSPQAANRTHNKIHK